MAVPTTAQVYLVPTGKTTEKALQVSVAAYYQGSLEPIPVQAWLPKSALIELGELSQDGWHQATVQFWIARKWNYEFNVLGRDEVTQKYLDWTLQRARHVA